MAENAADASARGTAANTNGSAAGPNGGANKGYKKAKKKPQDVALYDLLEVSWEATPEEIKKAYRKRALKLHPDKGGDPAQFHAMKRAYDVLSDESKRATYDTYGPEMLKVIEGEAGPEVFMMLLLKQRRFRALILIVAVLVVGFLILFPVLQSVRWDGADWSWAIVFIPLWFIMAIAFVGQMQLMFKGPVVAEGEEPPAKTAPPSAMDIISALLLFCCGVIFFAFVSARLDGTITWSWFAVIVPWLVFELTLCFQRYMGAREAVTRMKEQLQALKEYHERGAQEAKDGLEMGDMEAALRIHEAEEAIKSCDEDLKVLAVSKVYLFLSWFWPLLRFTTAFLIAGRADESFTGTWFLTAIPFIIGTIVFPYLEGMRASWDPETADSRARVCCSSGMQYGVALLIWLLGMAKMDNRSIYSGFAVWGPYFVLAGFVFINMTVILCINPDDLVQQQQQQNGGQQQQASAEQPPPAANGTDGTAATTSASAGEPTDKANVIILT